jgi:hypothetical protein
MKVEQGRLPDGNRLAIRPQPAPRTIEITRPHTGGRPARRCKVKVRSPIMLVLLVAATAAPAARPANPNTLDPAIAAAIRNHQVAAGQNGRGQAGAGAKYGPLDQAVATAIRNHRRAAGQKGSSQTSAAAKYGLLDPAIDAAIRNHSRGQDGVSRSASASAPAAAPEGFDWSAAGIGATVAFAAMLLGLAIARVIPRRSRARLA